VPGVGIGAGDDDDEVAVDARRNECFGAVENPIFAVAHRGGADACEVTASPRLRHGHRDDRLAADDPAHPTCLLLVGRKRLEIRSNDVVLQGQCRRRQAAPRQLLDDHRVESKVIGSATAVLLGHVEPDETVFSRRNVGRSIDQAVSIPPLRVRRDLTFDELPGGFAKRFVLGLEYRSLH
jgi:hypothetical protein